jgi:hypothetical protein
VAQLYPRALGSLFVASYDWQGHGGGILISCEIQSYVTTDSQSAVLMSSAHLGPATNFSFSLKLYLDSCEFVDVGRPL